ncbi:Protein of unknown function, partial [Gryllus bimaculatus]
MLNKAMPFDDTNIKRLHEQQMNRRWKFRSKVIDTLSEQDEATSEAVTVIKDNRGNLGPVKSEKIDDPRFKSPDEED